MSDQSSEQNLKFKFLSALIYNEWSQKLQSEKLQEDNNALLCVLSIAIGFGCIGSRDLLFMIIQHMPVCGWFKLKLTKVKSSNDGFSLIIIINNGRQCDVCLLCFAHRDVHLPLISMKYEGAG